MGVYSISRHENPDDMTGGAGRMGACPVG